MVETDYIWPDSWIPSTCVITSSQRCYQELNDQLSRFPSGYRRQFERRLKYIGQLDRPISNKNYMYQIEAGYYECYIFGKNSDLRLVFDWTKDVETGLVVIDIMGLTNHRGVKARKFKEADELDLEDELFLEMFL